VSTNERSCVVRLADERGRIPGPAGEHAVNCLRVGRLDVALSIPSTPVPQTPHSQDEIYVVLRGHGVLAHDGKRDPVAQGDLVFVAAGTQHQFEEIGGGFAVWRVFYGPEGGEN
jgi:mannose-6-phosphate isomerase-like protein (cupin superfamily)